MGLKRVKHYNSIIVLSNIIGASCRPRFGAWDGEQALPRAFISIFCHVGGGTRRRETKDPAKVRQLLTSPMASL